MIQTNPTTHQGDKSQPVIATYRRVSTIEQHPENQDKALSKYLQDRNWTATYNITDHIQGSVPWRERQLATIMDPHRKVEHLICYEMSRLGRSRSDVLHFLEQCTVIGITVHIVAANMTLDQTMGSKIITTMLTLMSELETDFLRARTIEGLHRARAQGKVLGRPKGKMSTHQLDAKADEMKRLLQINIPKTTIAKLVGVSRSTMHRFLKRLDHDPRSREST